MELVPKVCKGKSMHSANALLCNVCRECGDSKVLKCDEWLAESGFLHPNAYIALSVPHLHRKVYTSCNQGLSQHFFLSGYRKVNRWKVVSTHPGDVCWSAPVLSRGSPSQGFRVNSSPAMSRLMGSRRQFWDADKNASFARLRGRLKVSLC